MKTPYERRVEESVLFLKGWARDGFCPDVGVVLGSGLSGVFADSEIRQAISYNNLPGFKAAGIKGHAGDLCLVACGQRKVAVLRGRVHGYEGYDPGEVVHNVRTLIRWGVRTLVLTNAAGCLEPNWTIGDIMAITDQVNGTGLSPLTGVFGEGFGPRFVDMTAAYCPQALELARSVFMSHGRDVRTGVYFGVTGPAYETAAEVRMIRTAGASAVGMSTVLETLAARQLGARVLGLSCLTNFATGVKEAPVNHSAVVQVAAQQLDIFRAALPAICEQLPL